MARVVEACNVNPCPVQAWPWPVPNPNPVVSGESPS